MIVVSMIAIQTFMILYPAVVHGDRTSRDALIDVLPLSPSCRAIVQVESARCALMVLDALLWRRTAAAPLCALAVYIRR